MHTFLDISVTASHATYTALQAAINAAPFILHPHARPEQSPAHATEQKEKAKYYPYTGVIHHKQPACCTSITLCKKASRTLLTER